MFGWLEGLVGAIVDAMGSALGTIGTAISNAIWNTMLSLFAILTLQQEHMKQRL